MLQTTILAYAPAAGGSLADPAGSSVIVAAVAWLEGTLLGTIATSVAVIAVAWIGLMMLSGRTSLRRGATVIAGCFILFGASTIAAGIQGAASGSDVEAEAAAPPLPPPPAPPPTPPANRDPYAGAAVPGP